MDKKAEKLVMLALASENVDEAVAALRMARQQQPRGKLQLHLDQEWDRLMLERDKLKEERTAFEDERQTYQRGILIGERAAAARTGYAVLGEYARAVRKPAAAALLGLAILAGATYGAIASGGAAYAGDMITDRICATVTNAPLINCDG